MKTLTPIKTEVDRVSGGRSNRWRAPIQQGIDPGDLLSVLLGALFDLLL